MKKTELSDIYDKTVDKVYRYVYSRVGNKEMSEDIVSETYMTFISVCDNYDKSSKIETFIIGIARNKILQEIHKEKKNEKVDIDFETIILPKENNDEVFEKKTNRLAKKLDGVLAKLPNRYKKVIDYKYKHGLNNEEISNKMSISRQNLRVLQHRALKKAESLANNLNK